MRGSKGARRAHFPDVPWQRFQRHFLTNALERVPNTMESRLQRGCGGRGTTTRRTTKGGRSSERWGESLAAEHPELAGWLGVEGEDTLSCFHFPPGHRRRLRTTNGNGQVN